MRLIKPAGTAAASAPARITSPSAGGSIGRLLMAFSLGTVDRGIVRLTVKCVNRGA
jgi:hypothetical protein